MARDCNAHAKGNKTKKNAARRVSIKKSAASATRNRTRIKKSFASHTLLTRPRATVKNAFFTVLFCVFSTNRSHAHATSRRRAEKICVFFKNCSCNFQSNVYIILKTTFRALFVMQRHVV
jgi:hypothetical protein